jgi:hypothetical protein
MLLSLYTGEGESFQRSRFYGRRKDSDGAKFKFKYLTGLNLFRLKLGGWYIRKETFPVSSEDIFQASVDSVENLKWKIVEMNPESGEIKARIGASFK